MDTSAQSELLEGLKALYENPLGSLDFRDWEEVPSPDPNSRVISLRDGNAQAVLMVTGRGSETGLALSTRDRSLVNRNLILDVNPQEGASHDIALNLVRSFTSEIDYGVHAEYDKNHGRLKGPLTTFVSNKGGFSVRHPIDISDLSRVRVDEKKTWKGTITKNTENPYRIDIEHSSHPVRSGFERYIYTVLKLSKGLLTRDKHQISFDRLPIHMDPESISGIIRFMVNDAFFIGSEE